MEILESLVFNKLKPSTASTISNELIEECEYFKINGTVNIKKSFITTVLELKDIQLIEIYIQEQQDRLISLADTLYSYINTSIPKYIQKVLYTSVINLLSFLDKRFPKFINPDERIPIGFQFDVITEFKESLIILDQPKEKVFQKLLFITTAPIRNFIEEPEKINFEQVQYLKELKKVCLESLQELNNPTLYLAKKLININFNALSFFDWFTNYIRDSIGNSDNQLTEIDKLSWYFKEINQIQVYNQFHFNKNMRSIKDMVGQWLIEEISYLEKHNASLLEYSNNTNTLPQQGFKISTNLSVSQLAFLLRAMVDTEIIKSKNDRELIRFIATITQTKRVENISPESLRSKYYDFDENIKDEVKNFVIKILNYIQACK